MDDSAYDSMVSRFGEGDSKLASELAAEAGRRGDNRVLAAIALRGGPSAREARASGDRLALGRAIAGRAGLWHTWDPLVEEVSRWPDDDATRAAVSELARGLDDLGLDELREAPAAWWNAAQAGRTPVGWPLVRRLIFRERQQPLVPCAVADSLAQLTLIDADEHNLAPAMLAGARRVRSLHYEFSTAADRPADPIEPFTALAGTLRQLSLDIRHAATELLPVRALTGLTELHIRFGVADLGSRDPLAALAGLPLTALRLDGPAPLPSLAVLDQLPRLRLLHVDRAPADTAPIARLARLDELLLGRAAALPALPAALRNLHLVECDGLRSSDQLASLAQLDTLRLTSCRAVRALHLAGLGALRELAVSEGRLELLDLGAAPRLELLRLNALPALRELRFTAGRPARLERVSIEGCPALVRPAGL